MLAFAFLAEQNGFLRHQRLATDFKLLVPLATIGLDTPDINKWKCVGVCTHLGSFEKSSG